MYCSNCGQKLNKDDKFCPNCGERINIKENSSLAKSMRDKKKKVSDHSNYAGFWIRFMAYFVDMAILSLMIFALFFLIGYFLGDIYNLKTFSLILGYIITLLYFGLMQSSTTKATLGKMLFGLQVTSEDSKQISPGQATARFFSRILSAVIFLIGYIMIAFTSKKQGLHDKIANTVVVRDKKKSLILPIIIFILSLIVLTFYSVLDSRLDNRLDNKTSNSNMVNTRDSKRIWDIKQIQTAMELYYLDVGEYPKSSITQIGGMCLTNKGFESECTGETVYMGSIPFAPTPADADCTSADNSYRYERINNNDYNLFNI